MTYFNQAPFANVIGETYEQAAQRIAAIGRERLAAWWSVEKDKTYASTYGDSGSDRAASVAYSLLSGEAKNEPRGIAWRVQDIWEQAS